MPEYSWPSREASTVIGKVHDRLDGTVKATGAAKYTYDINLKNQLIAVAFGSPYAHCTIKNLDVSGAQKTPGVVHVEVLPQGKKDTEIEWEGELLAVVAAESEGAAREGLSNIKLTVDELDVFADESNLAAAEEAGRTGKGGGKVETVNEPGDDDDEDEFVEREIERLFKQAKYVVEGYYGIDPITHCCLEPHGSTVEWKDGKLEVHLSTQNVSGTDEQFARDLKVDADDVNVHCDYIGGGFGSKFAPDYWGIAAARISKATGRPVKFMLQRDQELKLGGSRPSGYLKVRLGADARGVVQVWDSQHWGSSGYRGGGVSHSVVPYVLVPKNYRRISTTIKANLANARAWRAPNHPQACAMTQTALDDLAAKMGADSYDIFMANLVNASNGKADVYRAEMEIGARLIDWKAKWHPHGKGASRGSIVDGLGMGLHTWGGTANTSSCLLKVYPDGGVEAFCGTQDLGTGTRTVCAQVLAETFGLGVNDVRINVGSSKYPNSGASGGSTTVGAVCESHRRAGQDALEKIFELAAKELGVDASVLEAVGGKIRDSANRNKSIAWRKACSLIGLKPLEVTSSYQRGADSPLTGSGVGGIQMAHVEVDKETGVIKIKKFVAVQDQGLVINPKTCKSQVFGAVIMGIAAALYEQRVTDPKSGKFINAELSDYKLARVGDIGDIVVELYEPESERQRGVIGNGEPPAISPKAAIANAVANALGVRVPTIPMTPKRVLDALAKA
ncbi:MAG: xanthine dehydrogenase family protein [Pirellulaceae bacterium]|jgi:xanthine dehydrogenase YagR molybdenum-binding subunit|nr:aldehyde oxidase [Planctomycetaceae bacterium]MDP6468705.1 xanthine dehydrogenase family protein [Pirellulaceae bacterium]MDP6555619.1 xanthine dehydrogenase family protein [Pirellulaceae bacterium]